MQDKLNIGLYAGSFQPFHLGHLNIVTKASKIFDKVIIARGYNPSKSIDSKFNNIPTDHNNIYLGHEYCVFTGFLTDFISELESKYSHYNITLIRGLRNGDDLDYEINQLRFMETMKSNINMVFIACDKQYEHLSSTSIRNIAQISTETAQQYLPPEKKQGIKLVN